MKYFTNKKCTKKNLVKLICQFAKEQGISKLTFNTQGKRLSGSYNPKTGSLYLNLKQTKHKIMCAFFHELGHHQAVKQNKWRRYHLNLVKSMNATEVYRIENKIDQIGKRLWNKYVYLKEWGKYKYFYPKSDLNYFLNTTTSL